MPLHFHFRVDRLQTVGEVHIEYDEMRHDSRVFHVICINQAGLTSSLDENDTYYVPCW